MYRHLIALATLFLIAGTSVSEDTMDPRTRDLLMITDWFEGEFDNEEQLWFHRRSAAPGEPPTRIHMSNARVALPAFGEHVFYVEEHKDNAPESVYRQRLVIFSSDEENSAIRMRQGLFADPPAVRGAHQNPARIAKLGAPDVMFMAGCDVYFRRVADQFHGEMASKQCVFGEGNERRYAVHTIALSQNKFWRTDATYLLSDDSFFVGTSPGEPTQLRRARTFYCDFYFDPLNGSAAQESRGHRVFRQGGSATVVRDADGPALEVLIREDV